MIQITERKKGKQRRVVFTLPDADHTQSVSVVGDFNEWDPTRHPMRHTGDGVWQAAVDLAPGEYQFRYLVNGSEWRNDEQAGACANPYGGENALLKL